MHYSEIFFLKRRKYYAKHYYRKPFGLKRDMQRLVDRRRPFGTPLPTRPCVIRVTFTQWINPVITRLTRCYIWKSTSRWIVHNLKQDSWTTRVVSMCLDPRFVLPASRLFRKACFHRDWFSLVPSGPMGFRGVWTPDSCSPHRTTPESIVTRHTKYPCR